VNKIVNYQIVRAEYTQELEQFVLTEIKKGWQPIGGALINENYILQTLALYKKEINE